MSDRKVLLHLAERVEALTEPDREVDAQIACVIRWHPYGPDHWASAPGLAFIPTAGGWMAAYRDADPSLAWPSLEFTGSLDAAMALVPEGERYELANMGDGVHRGFVTASDLIPWDDFECRPGASAALALCAAAIRARAATS